MLRKWTMERPGRGRMWDYRGLTWTVLWEWKWRGLDTGYDSTVASRGLPADSLSSVKEDKEAGMTQFSFLFSAM